MATTIEVNKVSIEELLKSGAKEQFVIPEYQRPYAWSEEEVSILFNDLIDYTKSELEASYFLGCIVSYTNENNKQEIIDGQQRITTLFLLIRAIYFKLENMSENEMRENFLGKIKPCLWKLDKLTGKVNQKDILIESEVLESNYNNALSEILETGIGSGSDPYSKNYNYLISALDEFATNEPLLFYNFIYNILEKTIVLPIKADSQETALTIFSTLNDRGLPLSDADIFKAKIYNYLSLNQKQDFIDKWQQISINAVESGESIQKLFYYYMFYLRALENDKATTTPGLRKYYATNNFQKLYECNLLNNLENICNFWSVVNKRTIIEDEKWSINLKILSLLDILSSYPNEFWKYPVIIFYLKNKDNSDFESEFVVFLQKLFMFLFYKYLISPTINAVKGNILTLNASILHNNIDLDLSIIDIENLKDRLKMPNKNLVRMILKFLAYQDAEQTKLLPIKWDIEHILPVKWDNNFFFNINKEEIESTIENIGNKIPFEKKLNISASNGYFSQKQEKYKKSNIAIVKKLGNKNIKEWKLDEIRDRNSDIKTLIANVFNEWIKNN